MFGYEYTSPSPTQLAIRRQQLDQAGFTAWLSPIFILATVYLYRYRRLSTSAQSSTPNRPSTAFQRLTRRTSWLLNSPLNPALGPPFLILASTMYLLFLAYIAARNTTNDYMHLTKSLGHVAVSQLPWHYLLAIKSPLSPITLATGLTHERLNAWHRALGRVIAVLAFGHAGLYLKFFADVGALPRRVGDRDVQMGLMAVSTLALLVGGSLPVVRKGMYYKGFYVGHVLGSAALVVILWLHMTWTRRYVLQMGVYWVTNAWLRRRAARRMQAQVEQARSHSSELLIVKLRPTKGENDLLEGLMPGQHVYLRLSDGFLGSMLGRKNPFTVADLSEDGKQWTLVARRLAGATTLLPNYHNKVVLLEGPYGEASEYMPGLLSAGKKAGQVLLVAGGVGATYTVPIYLALLKARVDTEKLKLIWFVKELSEASWALELLENTGAKIDVELFITRAGTSESHLPKLNIEGLTINPPNGPRSDAGTIVDSAMTPKQELSKESKKDPRARKLKKSYEKITIMVCGPPGLSTAVRGAVGRHVLGYGREVAWYEEQFGFGA